MANCLISGSGSSAKIRSRTASAVKPSSRYFKPLIPMYGLTNDCEAMAPTPALTYGHTAPTAGTFVDTATPNCPVRSHLAVIENVFSSNIVIHLSIKNHLIQYKPQNNT